MSLIELYSELEEHFCNWELQSKTGILPAHKRMVTKWFYGCLSVGSYLIELEERKITSDKELMDYFYALEYYKKSKGDS